MTFFHFDSLISRKRIAASIPKPESVRDGARSASYSLRRDIAPPSLSLPLLVSLDHFNDPNVKGSAFPSASELLRGLDSQDLAPLLDTPLDPAQEAGIADLALTELLDLLPREPAPEGLHCLGREDLLEPGELRLREPEA